MSHTRSAVACLLTLLVALPATATPSPGPDAGGYRSRDDIGFTWLNLAGAATVPGSAPNGGLADNEYSSAVPLGFSFTFYGASHTSAYVNSNGFLSFATDGTAAQQATPASLPSAGGPSSLVAGFWTDLDPSLTLAGLCSPSVTYATLGSAPNRIFVVEYAGVPHAGQVAPCLPQTTSTFQVRLAEGSNHAEVQIQQATSRCFGCPAPLGSAAVGTEGGSAGLEYAFGSNVEFTALGVRFYPNAVPVGVGEGPFPATPGTLGFLFPSVLMNDSDADGDALTAVLVGVPAQATSFTLDPTGWVSWYFPAGSCGSDSFTYAPDDGIDTGNSVTVTLNLPAC